MSTLLSRRRFLATGSAFSGSLLLGARGASDSNAATPAAAAPSCASAMWIRTTAKTLKEYRDFRKFADTAFLGNAQVDWLVGELAKSTATWKVIAADMPIGLGVNDGKDAQGKDKWEAIANGDNGAPSGRELEIARVLRAIKPVKNVVWMPPTSITPRPTMTIRPRPSSPISRRSGNSWPAQ